MKLQRQFLQLLGTVFLLFSVLLALRLTAPPEADPVNRHPKTIRTASGSKPDIGRSVAVGRHEDAPPSRPGSFEWSASRPSRVVTQGEGLQHDREPEPPISEMNQVISFRDPIIARFQELETMKLQTMDPDLAGHSLPAFGHRAVVEEARQVSGTTGMMLTLSIDPITPTTDENPPLSEPASAANPQAQPDSEIVTNSKTANPWNGLSYEQELFRTKWGWQAFDQVQKALREQHSP